MKRLNCWEFNQCGREPGGSKTNELGVCPSSIHYFYNDVNHGKNAGRFCWSVNGCYATKDKNNLTFCLNCNFFKHVSMQEKDAFILLKKDMNAFSEMGKRKTG